MMKRYPRTIRKRINKNKKCYFCEQKTIPDYKETDSLRRNLSERGKIVERVYTGVCQKHQRGLSKAIKRARFMALLPFIVRAS